VQGVVNPDSDGLASQLELSPDEVLTLHALQCQMMRTDLGRERKDRGRVGKSEIDLPWATMAGAAASIIVEHVPEAYTSVAGEFRCPEGGYV